jgi:hypothetical protein
MALDDPELMRIWGTINAEWDDIELWLYFAFDSMIDDDEFLTQAIFYSQKNHAARRDMVESLAKYFFRKNEKDYQPLKNAIKRVRARSQARNELTHGTWFVQLSDGAPDLQIGRAFMSPDETVSLNRPYFRADLKRVADEMADTAKALREAVEPWKKQKMARRAPSTPGWGEIPKLLP